MARILQATWILALVLANLRLSLAGLEVTYEWKYIDYTWHNDSHKADAITAGGYDYTNIVIHDVQELTGDRILVTTPRYANNPASLSLISNQTGDGGPLLEPYPDWEWHQSSGGIISVGRVVFDDCGLLWMVDTGRIADTQVLPPALIAIDSYSDWVLLMLDIPDELLTTSTDSTKARIDVAAVETRGDVCEEIWVYMTDTENGGIIIYNGTAMWRLDDDIFVPEDTTLTIGDDEVATNIYSLSISIIPDGYLEDSTVLFKPVNSKESYAVSADDLHNSWSSDVSPTFYIADQYEAPSTELTRGIAYNGVMMATYASDSSLACWNIQNSLTADYVHTLETNEETLAFTTALKMGLVYDNDPTFWIVSNRLRKLLLGTMDFDEVNFRVLFGDVLELVNGTVCEPSDDTTVASSIEEKNFSVYTGTS